MCFSTSTTHRKVMDFSLFKLDIDELIDEFVKGGSTTFADMKRVWLTRKFTYIFEASPSTNLALFMQTLYNHTIGYMVSTGSLSHRLGGLYSLYCLYETQPFKPPFKIYIFLGHLKRLQNLVVDAKEKGVKVVSAIVKRMLERNMFLFGFVDLNEHSFTERVNELTELQNSYIRAAYKRLLGDTRAEHFLHMDMGMELDLEQIKKLSTDYAKAKELAINEASEVVDVQNIKHIAGNRELIGEKMEKITEDWNFQRAEFYQRTGLTQQHADEQHQLENGEQQEGEDFDKELEQLLSTP